MVDVSQMKSWAEEAIRKAREVAGVDLDYAQGSIGKLESALDQLRDNSRSESDTWDLACRFGAYFGETMLRNGFAELGYAWAEDYDGEPCLITSKPQEGASLDKILPITKVNKYLLSGPTESPAKLYAMCLSMLKGGDMTSNLASLGVDPSKTPGVEPLYVNKGKFDANAAAWLLYGDYVFFRPQEIVWDGTTHRIVGLQVNAAKMNDIPTLLANTSLLNGLVDLLTELEKDEGLRVPLAMVHPGLHEALRNEDLTGITLFNLMACAQALIIKEPSQDSYQVMCDVRLPMGIPAFYQLVARMIWGMRVYNGRSGTYAVTFANARNFDADACIGEVDQMVPGAFSQPMWRVDVSTKPQVELPSSGEVQAFAKEASRVFASGFDDPMDIQADEDLFVATLNQLAREFPLTRDIEGTHHMGRIPRIEHVRVADPLVLAADWQSEFFDPACIEVFNAAGETLGNLREQFSPALSGNRELACLLPHITATVETVTPKSKRRRNAKYALMDVRMELDPAVMGPDGNLLPEVIRDAKALLALPRSERVVVSKGGVVASQLKGNIKVDEARDAPNPLGKTFRLWEVETDGGVADEAEPESVFEPEAPQTAAVTREGPQQAFDTSRWTFDRHQLVQARRFFIEVPDQWEPGSDESGRILAQYVQGIDDENEYPEIICNSMLGDLESDVQESYRSTMIPEMRIQTNRNVFYSNDLMNKLSRIVNDWVIEGKNCQVQVFEVRMKSLFPDVFPDTYEYDLKPIAYDHEDFMRITDSNGHLGDGELKALAFAVARSVELDKPVELQRLVQLGQFAEELTDADTFRESVNVVGNLLAKADNARMNANLYRAVRQADNEMRVLLIGDTMPLIQAEAFNEGLREQVAYFGRFVDALEKQAELGASDFRAMWEGLGEYADALIVDHFTMDDKEAEAKVNALGVIRIPEEYAALRERYEALKPGKDGRPGKVAATATAAAAAAEPAVSKTAQRRAERKAREEAASKRRAEEKKRKAEEAKRRAEEARRKAQAEAEAKRKAEAEAKRKAAEAARYQETAEEREARLEREVMKLIESGVHDDEDICERIANDPHNQKYPKPLSKYEVKRMIRALQKDERIEYYFKPGHSLHKPHWIHERYRWHLKNPGKTPADVERMSGIERAKLAHELILEQFARRTYHCCDRGSREDELAKLAIDLGGAVSEKQMIDKAGNLAYAWITGGDFYDPKILPASPENQAKFITSALGRAIKSYHNMTFPIMVKRHDAYYAWCQHDIKGDPIPDPYAGFEQLKRQVEAGRKQCDGYKATETALAEAQERVVQLKQEIKSFGWFGGGEEKRAKKAELAKTQQDIVALKKQRQAIPKDYETAQKALEDQLSQRMADCERLKDRFRWY